jgi:hypothetical protein
MRWPDTGELMAWLNQVAQITLINLQNVPRRLGTSLVVVVGIAGVVGVLVSVLAMSEGFRHTLSSTGRSSPAAWRATRRSCSPACRPSRATTAAARSPRPRSW